MNKRTLRRQAMKAQGISLRNGPAKGSTGQEKGPAGSMTLVEQRKQARMHAAMAELAAEVAKKDAA